MSIKQKLINMTGCIVARYIINQCNDGLAVTRRSGNKQIIKVYSEQAYKNVIKPAIHREVDFVHRAYRDDLDFRRYVNRYCANRGFMVDEALRHKLVRKMAQQYIEEKKGADKEDCGMS